VTEPPAAGDLGTLRQETIDVLCEQFANDALSVEEFERRLDRAHEAMGLEDLRKLLSDLPSGDLPVLHQMSGPAPAGRWQGSVPASRVRERGWVVAALGGVEKAGRWVPARSTYGVAVMGGLVLDFREALLPPGVTEVWLFTLMGGAEIIVPPGLSVESDGVAVLGGFEHQEDVSLNPDPDAPLLRLRGVALMGGVEVSIRYPGESQRDAKRRRRLDRKNKGRLRDGS
jgi:hypothetical protein